VEADLALGRGGRRLEEWLEFAPDNLQGLVVLEECVVNCGEAFDYVRIGGDVLAHLDEGADDIEAHGNRPGAVEDGGGHDGAVLGEGPGKVLSVLAAPGL